MKITNTLKALVGAVLAASLLAPSPALAGHMVAPQAVSQQAPAASTSMPAKSLYGTKLCTTMKGKLYARTVRTYAGGKRDLITLWPSGLYVRPEAGPDIYYRFDHTRDQNGKVTYWQWVTGTKDDGPQYRGTVRSGSSVTIVFWFAGERVASQTRWAQCRITT